MQIFVSQVSVRPNLCTWHKYSLLALSTNHMVLEEALNPGQGASVWAELGVVSAVYPVLA